MKTIRFMERMVFCCLLMMATILPTVHAQSYTKLWKDVEQAQKKDLPQTVIQLTERIAHKAEQEQNAPQLLKAIVCRNDYQDKLTPDSLLTNLKALEKWAGQEPDSTNKAILHSLLAEKYNVFLQQNLWTIKSRTELQSDDIPADIREWTASLFIDRIDQHLRTSLANEKQLMKISTKEYTPFIEQEEGSRFYGHDLYHLLMRRAIHLYQQWNNLNIDSLQQARITGLYTHAIDLYAQQARSEDAVIFCTLDYLNYQRNQNRTEENIYLQGLDALLSKYGSRAACGEVLIAKATYLQSKSRYAEALRLCDEGLKQYSSYPRINALKNLRAQILQPALSYRTYNSAYPGDSIELRISYKNLDGFTWNLYATNLDEVPYSYDEDDIKKHRRNKLSSIHFSLKPLPKTGMPEEDWKYQHSDTLFKIRVPDNLGVYIYQAVPDAKGNEPRSHLLTTTRLKVLGLDTGDKQQVEFITIDAQSGHPIANATLSFYDYTGNKLLKEVTTGADGKVLVQTNADMRHYVARKDNDRSMRPQYFYRHGSVSPGYSNEWNKVLTLLSDRAIYRPGQTVYIKGIAHQQNQDSAHVLTNETYELSLLDVNRKEIATQKVTTNEFGSFTAEFTLPAACLNGTFTIRDKKTNHGSITFRVEEYKRPSFEITFNPVTKAYLLGDTITLTGNVKAYNGMTIQEVPLAYRVTYHTFMPRIWRMQQKPLQADTIRLDANGNFSIPLKLTIPEDEVQKDRIHTFDFAVTVTDEAGETQEASYQLMASSRAYYFESSLPTYICKEDSLSYTFRVKNISDIEQQISGTYQLFAVPDNLKYLHKDSDVLFIIDGIASGQESLKNISTNDILSIKVVKGEHTKLYGERGKNGVVVVTTRKGKPNGIQEKPVLEGTFISGQPLDCSAWKALPSGNYRLVLSVRDSLGREENSGQTGGGTSFMLFSKADKRPAAFCTTFSYSENTEFDAQHPAAFLFGTSYKDAYVFMDIFRERKRIESRVLQLNDTILRMEFPYEERYGNGIDIYFCFVKDDNLYTQKMSLQKRRPDRTLNMKWETFRDRLLPGQQEEWKLIIKTPQGTPANAELLALMYDASLDKLYQRAQSLHVTFPVPWYYVQRESSNFDLGNNSLYFPFKSVQVKDWLYDHFWRPQLLSFARDEAIVIGYQSATAKSLTGKMANMRVRGTAVADKVTIEESEEESGQAVEIKYVPAAAEAGASANGTLSPMEGLRTNFAETAFFYPQLRTNEQGEVVISFTAPQSLTRWNFQGIAHTKEMLTGQLTASAVTAKEFMQTPNLPRFVRVGDRTEIAATIANRTQQAVKGTAKLTLFDPMTNKVISTQRAKFKLEPGRNTAVSFRFEATDRYDLLGVRLTAEGDNYSDGEQHLLPVLSNKEYLTETLPLPIRGEETRTFALDSLFNRNSPTATHRRLTVEFTGNPAWYAVQALPTLSLPTNDNAIAWATTLYANTIAGYIANSQPRIKTLFDSWRAQGGNKEDFLSQLEKNQEVKNILLNESPWVMEATTEAEQRARIATLFDLNLQSNRLQSAITKLAALQDSEGAWTWYKGMPGNRYITTYITGLLLRMSMLTGQPLPEEVAAMKQKALDYLHREALNEYKQLRKQEKEQKSSIGLSNNALEYLYLIALDGGEVPTKYQTAYRYFLDRLTRQLPMNSMWRKAQAAVILHKAGRTEQAAQCLASLREHLVQEDELGAHFAFNDTPYDWRMMPVPAHVAAMEAFTLAGGYEDLIEEMKIWLLKQKQTNAWNACTATADATYALLCLGTDLLESRGEVRITLGKTVLETYPEAPAARPQTGSSAPGYVKEVFTEGSNALKARSVTVEKRDKGIAWGAVYAQYLSPISDVKQSGGALNVEKKLYVERVSADGKKSLEPIHADTRLAVGDKVVARLTLRTDRAMDFIQLKDQRGACFEPIGSLSGCRWQNGLCFYQEIEDSGTNYFFSHLGKGVYVLEHSYRVSRAGTYQTGLATIQCAYAPEYAAHSTGGTVVIE